MFEPYVRGLQAAIKVVDDVVNRFFDGPQSRCIIGMAATGNQQFHGFFMVEYDMAAENQAIFTFNRGGNSIF